MVTKLEVGEIHRTDLPREHIFQSLLDDYKPENSDPLTRIVVITTIQLIILGIYLE
jgi:hypothetical protein